MKKIVVLSTLLASSLLLSSCSIDPMASGVAVMAQDVTTATNDRRSPGELIDDKNIYKKLNNIVKNDSMLENSHITFLVYGKSAAILGEAPTAEAVDYLEKQIKKNIPSIKQLINEIVIEKNSSYFSRAKDGIISTQIETLFEYTIIKLYTISSIFLGENIQSLLPVLGVFSVASIRLKSTSSKLIQSISRIKQHQFATQRLWEDLKYFKSFEKGQILPNDSIQLPSNSPFHSVRFENISFSYKKATVFALKQITFTINNGDSIGIIGKSGAGKTTLVDVLLGLLIPQSGTISLNEEELNDENLKKWRKQVAYIPQEIFLIDDSLKKNIALGINDEEICEERLRKAIRQARLDELVQQLPQKVDTVIGERGIRLSGGQRQRVALARAFYYQRNVLIMDEATSALDNETENEIIDEIKDLEGKVTLIIIAHRLSTLKYCNKIYRLEAGQIITEGSFEEVVGHTNS